MSWCSSGVSLRRHSTTPKSPQHLSRRPWACTGACTRTPRKRARRVPPEARGLGPGGDGCAKTCQSAWSSRFHAHIRGNISFGDGVALSMYDGRRRRKGYVSQPAKNFADALAGAGFHGRNLTKSYWRRKRISRGGSSAATSNGSILISRLRHVLTQLLRGQDLTTSRHTHEKMSRRCSRSRYTTG